MLTGYSNAPSSRAAKDANKWAFCGVDHETTKSTLVDSVPVGVVTCTLPVVAPTGTNVVISVSELTVNSAETPLKVTLVVPVKLWPRRSTFVPTPREGGTAATNGLSPFDSVKAVPQPFSGQLEFAPYSSVVP